MTGYKWQLLIFKDAPKCPYFLKPLPGSEVVDRKYLHRPGDIDYSELSKLSKEEKESIKKYVASPHVPGDPMEFGAYIAAIINIDRLWDPNFMPAELG